MYLVVSWMDCDPQTHQMNNSQCTVDLTMDHHKFKLMMNVQFIGSHFVSGHLLRDSGIQGTPQGVFTLQEISPKSVHKQVQGA